MSEHGYLEREQVRIEQERDLAFQQARVNELNAGVEESRRRRDSMVAEFERGTVGAKVDADKRAALLEQELVKVKLGKAVIHVDERGVNLTSGMAVSAEISTGKRTVLEFFLDPIKRAAHEGLRER